MSQELATIDTADVSIVRPPEAVLAEAQKAAKALNEVISKKNKPVKFNGEQYLEFEDWQTVGKFYGVVAKVTQTTPVTLGNASGFEARAVVLHAGTGREISAAEAMCLNDEPNWKNKPLFQLRSMAQTRACAKALRNVLAWVVVLAGYKPTPAEEMDGLISKAQPAPRPAQPVSSPSQPNDGGVVEVEGRIGDYTPQQGNKPGKFVVESMDGSSVEVGYWKSEMVQGIEHGGLFRVTYAKKVSKQGRAYNDLIKPIEWINEESGEVSE